jgi:O-antigen/teichoic acid export membrane protein
VLIILSLTLIPSGQLMVLYMVITAMDRQADWVRLIAVALAFGIGLNLVLIPIFQHLTGNGGIGAAVASLAAEATQLVLATRLMPRGLYNRELRLQSQRAIVAVGVMAAMVVGLQVIFDASIFVFVPVGAVTYAAALLASGAVSVTDLQRLSQDWLSSRSGAPARRDAGPAIAFTE